HPALASAPPASEREPGTPRRPVASGRRLAADRLKGPHAQSASVVDEGRPAPARMSCGPARQNEDGLALRDRLVALVHGDEIEGDLPSLVDDPLRGAATPRPRDF